MWLSKHRNYFRIQIAEHTSDELNNLDLYTYGKISYESVIDGTCHMREEVKNMYLQSSTAGHSNVADS